MRLKLMALNVQELMIKLSFSEKKSTIRSGEDKTEQFRLLHKKGIRDLHSLPKIVRQ